MNIFKLFGSIFSINILEYLISLLSTILVVKKLSIVEYGTYNFLNTFAALVLTFFTLGLTQYNYKIIPGRDQQTRYKILGNSLFVELISTFLGIIVIYFISHKQIMLNALYLIFFVRLLFCTINNELIRYFGYEKRIIIKSIVGFIDAKLWVFMLLFLLFVGANINVSKIIFVQCVNSIITLFICCFLLSNKLIIKNFKYDSYFVKVHVKNALAFIFVDLGMYILEMSVRYILTFYGAELSLGLFSFAYNWVSIIFKFGMLVIYALQPYLSHTYYLSSLNGNYTAKLYQLEKLMIKYSMYILFFGATYFIIFFYDLVILIGKNDYLQTRISIVFLAPLTIFMCISYFLQIIILLAGRSNRIPICYFSIAGLNIVLNFIFVPIFDYKASALINSFSYLILMLMFIIIVPKDAVKLKYSIKEYMSFIVEYFIFVVVMLGINRILQVSPLIKFVISFFILLLFIFLILLRNKIDFYSLNELVKDEGK